MSAHAHRTLPDSLALSLSLSLVAAGEAASAGINREPKVPGPAVSESHIRVTYPSHIYESYVRIIYPSHMSESYVRVIYRGVNAGPAARGGAPLRPVVSHV
jgi:hypothetical protein